MCNPGFAAYHTNCPRFPVVDGWSAQNCKHPKLSNLLTGKKRSTPLTLVDMAGGMGGGASRGERDWMHPAKLAVLTTSCCIIMIPWSHSSHDWMHKSTVNGKHEANIPSEVMKLGRDLGFFSYRNGELSRCYFSGQRSASWDLPGSRAVVLSVRIGSPSYLYGEDEVGHSGIGSFWGCFSIFWDKTTLMYDWLSLSAVLLLALKYSYIYIFENNIDRSTLKPYVCVYIYRCI